MFIYDKRLMQRNAELQRNAEQFNELNIRCNKK
jgi:hypothetical protein